MKFTRLNALALAASLASTGAPAADTIKLAYLEPLSGGMANVGEEGAHNFQFVIDQLNAAGGALGRKFELVPLDNKLSPQESLIQLKTIIDQKIQYVTQGQGSSVAGALIEALNKHNERNPESRVLFLNYAAVDPDLTNSKCSFWHFRLDANTDRPVERQHETTPQASMVALKEWLERRDGSRNRMKRPSALGGSRPRRIVLLANHALFYAPIRSRRGRGR